MVEDLWQSEVVEAMDFCSWCGGLAISMKFPRDFNASEVENVYEESMFKSIFHLTASSV